MSDLDPMAQIEVESEIRRLVKELADITRDVAESSTNEAQARVTFKTMYAQAYLSAKGTVDERRAKAQDEAEVAFEELEFAQAAARAAQEAGRNVRCSLDAMRTLAANVRSSVQHSTGEGW